MTPLLSVRNLKVAFGATEAVRGLVNDIKVATGLRQIKPGRGAVADHGGNSMSEGFS